MKINELILMIIFLVLYSTNVEFWEDYMHKEIMALWYLLINCSSFTYMHYSITIRILLASSIIFLMCACTSNPQNTEEYIAIYKRDTAYLSLQLFESSYYGKMEIKGVGRNRDVGRIRGKIEGDMLVGDFTYIPHRTKDEKKRAFVLKRQGNQLIQGSGLESIYMGMPYYSPGSISFENPKFVFKKK